MDAAGVYVSRVSESPTPESDDLAYLREAPVESILANHLFVLVQLGALRLAAVPPELDAARLVIDTVGAIIEAAGDRLGEHHGLYRTALSELQRAYVRAATPGSS